MAIPAFEDTFPIDSNPPAFEDTVPVDVPAPAFEDTVPISRSADEIIEEYNPQGMMEFEDRQIINGRLVSEKGMLLNNLIELKSKIPQHVPLQAPRQIHEMYKKSRKAYDEAFENAPLEVKAEMKRQELRDRYDYLKSQFAGQDVINDSVANEINEIDEQLNLTDESIERRVLSGRANNWIDRERFGRYSTHKSQEIANLYNLGSKSDLKREINRLEEMETVASQTMPDGENLVAKAGYGLLGSIGSMVESGIAGRMVPGSDKLYWALQGQGSIIKEYVSENGIDVEKMSDEDFKRLGDIAKIGGGIYAAVEYIGSSFGWQGKGIDSIILNKMVGKAMKDDVFFNRLKRGGAKFFVNWMLENSEEGIQGFVTEYSKELVGDNPDVINAISKGADNFIQSLPTTFATSILFGTGSSIKTKRNAKKYQEKLESRGVDKTEAKKIARLMTEADTQEEFDAAQKIADKYVVVSPKFNRDRAFDLMSRKKLSKEERIEFDELMKLADPLVAIDFEETRLINDVDELSITDPLVISPDNIKPDTPVNNPSLKQTALILSEMYGREVSPDEVKDAFVDPVEKVNLGSPKAIREERSRKIEEISRQNERLSEGKGTRAELYDAISNVDPDLLIELKERTTGNEQENFEDVLEDIVIRKKQEIEDDSKRKQTIRAKQESIEEKQQPYTDVESGEEVIEDEQILRETEDKKILEKPVIEEIDAEKQTPAKIEKDVFPPNPQLPNAKWYRQMMDFALKSVQVGTTKAEFISDMEADYLHYDYTSEDLANIYEGAKIENKRIKKALKDAEKANLKGTKIKQKISPKSEKILVDAAKATRDWFRIQSKASKEGKKVGLKQGKEEIRAKFKVWRDNADAFKNQFRESIKGMTGATAEERAKLSAEMYKLYAQKGEKSQQRQFERLMEKLEDVKFSINDRTPIYDVRPQSKYRDVRLRFISQFDGLEERLGRRVSSKAEMIDYIEGRKHIPTEIIDEINQMRNRGEVGNIAERILRAADMVKDFFKLFSSNSTGVREIAPEVARALYQIEQDSATDATESARRVKKFTDSYKNVRKKLSNFNRQRLNAAIANGDQKLIKEFGIEGYDDVRRELDAYAEAFGIEKNQLYFPRIVKDLEGLQSFLEVSPTGVYAGQLKGVKGRDARLSKIRGITADTKSYGASNFKKSRNIDIVTPDMAAFYEDADIALLNRFKQMARAKAMNTHMGIDPKFKNGEISGFDDISRGETVVMPEAIEAMLTSGAFTDKQQNELRQRLQVQLFKKKPLKGFDKANEVYRKLAAVKLVSQISTMIIQLADAGVTIAENNIVNYSGFWRKKSDINKWKDASGKAITDSLEDFGIESLDVDVRDGMVKGLNAIFAGLRAMDSSQKRTMIRSVMNNWYRLAKKNPSKLENILNEKFGVEGFSKRVVEDASKGIMSKNVRLALFMEMAGYHPTTNLEKTVLQMNNPEFGFMFVLKSFALKRYDRFYRSIARNYIDGISRISAGTVDNNERIVNSGKEKLKKANKEFVKYALGTVAAEAAIRSIMNKIIGSDEEQEEELLDSFLSKSANESITTVFPFLSKYNFEEAYSQKSLDPLITGALDIPSPIGADDLPKAAYAAVVEGDYEKAKKYGWREVPWIGRVMSKRYE